MKMKDDTTGNILKQLQSSLQEWDSNKCPAVKSHIERLKQGASEETFSEAPGSLVGSQREDLKPSLKEAGTDVNWEMVGPIIAVVALALIAVIIVIVVCCLKKKYRYYLSNTFWEPGSLLKTSKYHETYPCTISGRYPSKIWWGRWRTKYKEQELKAAIEPHYILKKVQFESWNN